MHYISANVKKLMEVKNLSISELARQTGVSKATISRWFSEDKTPRLDMITKIANKYELPLDYFLDDSFTEYWKLTDDGWIEKDDPENERVYETSAGRGRFNESWEPNSPDGNDVTIVRICGDSMEPSLHDGDLVKMRHATNASPSDYAIIKINGDECCCKHVETTDTGIWIRSENKAYEDIFYSVKDILSLPITIIGIAEEIVSRKL